MKLSSLILTLTEDCNFRCKYCYQARGKHYMSWETAKQTLDFFLPMMKKNYKISFLGGEPFLSFDLIKKAVDYIKSKNRELSKSVRFAVSTNGSLLADHVLDFLNRNKFIAELSFDGFVQDSGRKKNSFAKTVAIIENALTLKNISLGTNSTFTGATAASIRESLLFIMGLGVKKISLSLDLTKRWSQAAIIILAEEIEGLRKSLLENYRKTGTIPVTLFREKNERRFWQCPAGIKQLTVTGPGGIWGCPCFYEYFKGREASREYREYFFGDLAEFAADYEKRYREISLNHRQFRIDNFYTRDSRCFLCPFVERCTVCPVIRKSSQHPLLYAHPDICKINRVLISEQEKFDEGIAVTHI